MCDKGKIPVKLKPVNNILFASLASLFLLPVLPALVTHILVGLFAVITLVAFVKTPARVFNYRILLLTSGLYLCYLLSLTYTVNVEYGLRKLSTCASLIIFPLLFSFLQPAFIQLIRLKIKEFLKIYVGAVVLLVVLSISIHFASMNFLNLSTAFDTVKIYGGLFEMDPLYLSMHVAIAAILSAYLFYISLKVWKAVLAVILLVVLFTALVLLSFKSTVIAFLIGLGALALFVNEKKLWSLFMAGFVSTLILVSFSKPLNHRFTELLIVKTEQTGDLTSAKIRASIDSCARILLPEAGILGYGIGDGKIVFLDCLEEKEPVLYAVSYNTHNQYTSIVLYAGYAALIVFLLSLIINIVLSVNSKNPLAIALTTLFVIIMFSENILERQQGVMPFAIFTTLLYTLNFVTSKKEYLKLSHEKVIKEIE